MRYWKDVGGRREVIRKCWGNDVAEPHGKYSAKSLLLRLAYVVIIPIALNKLDTEILAAHHIISHYSSDHIQRRK